MSRSIRHRRTDGQRLLSGFALQVSIFVSAIFLAVSSFAAAVDLTNRHPWDSPMLQNWGLVAQIVVGAGLLFLARFEKSRSFFVLGVLIAMIAIEEAFHVLNPVAGLLVDYARMSSESNRVRVNVVSGLLVYGLVALLGIGMLLASHIPGSSRERRIVRSVAVMLLAAGFFAGPISTLSTIRDPRLWVFVEEFGEALAFSVLAGYVVGIVVASVIRANSLRTSLDRRVHP